MGFFDVPPPADGTLWAQFGSIRQYVAAQKRWRLRPTLTTAELALVGGRYVGLQAYNSTTGTLQVWNGSAWVDAVSGGGGATQAAAATASPAAGTYTTTQTITLSSTTPGAVIRYTTDGSTPTAASPIYTGPITVSSTMTIKAIVMASGYTDSAVVTLAFVINAGASQAADPTFSPAAGTFSSAQSITIASTTPGASIYYTTDGSTPTTGSTLYTGPVSVASSLTLKAIAVASGFTASNVSAAAYTITVAGQVATPTFSPAAGTYSSAQSVTIATSTSGATIHYTTDGTTPTTGSPVYSGAVSVSATSTLKALAVKAGMTDSAIATAAYTITPAQVAPPTFSPAAGTYASTQSVTISTTTPFATIYYTTDGSTPTAASAVYSGPVSVAATSTLKAFATASGLTDSAVATAAYTITGATLLTITPSSISLTQGQSASIQFSASGGSGTLTWDAATGVPAGMTFDTNTGILSGPPSGSGSYSITISASTTGGQSGSITINGTISDEDVEGLVKDFQFFENNGTWTKPSVGTRVRIIAYGGGQAGQDYNAAATDIKGGDAGDCVVQWYDLSALPATLAISIGAGGSTSNAPGANTTVHSITASGGGNTSSYATLSSGGMVLRGGRGGLVDPSSVGDSRGLAYGGDAAGPYGARGGGPSQKGMIPGGGGGAGISVNLPLGQSGGKGSVIIEVY